MHEAKQKQSKYSTKKMKNKASQFVFFLWILIIDIFFSRYVYSQDPTISVNVGVVIDVGSEFGTMGLNSINMALTDFYNAHPGYRTRIVLHTRDSKDDIVGAAAAALDLIENVQVKAILGPDSSMQTDFVIHLGDKAHVPIITYSATSPSLSSSRSPYFFRAALNDSSQVQAISSIIKAFGWRQVVPIYVDNDFGEGFIPYLTDALQLVDARVPYRSVIPPLATDDQIEKELYKLMTMQTRVFVVHMNEDLGAKVFEMAEKIGMMSDGYAWIVTNGIANTLNLINSSVIVKSMQGVLGVKTYVPPSTLLEEFKIRWAKKFLNSGLSIFTLWAYDATYALAMAVEKVNTTTFTYRNNTNISSTFTDLETLGTSQSGIELQQKLSTTRFKGLAGDFNLVKGELQSFTFQFINVIGNGENGVGFWTPIYGITKTMDFTNTMPYSTLKDSLVPIFWPGKTAVVPKGWDIPTNMKRLKIGVPARVGFSEFVKVRKDTNTNATIITGYCIDVFKAVLGAMPYNVPYEFVPYALPNGSISGSYDQFVYEVYLQNFDVVVGDVTIVANRSEYVDFALPYAESGVALVVPIKDEQYKSFFVFMQPWTGNLWIATCCFFVLIGFVTWVLEHRINEDFRGPPSFQATTIFWFSFSTMVFAHKENVLSGWGRFIVAIWLFVVLILTQSYTASLTSMLTVQRLEPAYTDVKELIKTGEYIGYQKGSFVLEALKKMNIDESRLRTYTTPEECHELFVKGGANGGIAAAFDETPYMRLFLGHYCSKYTMVGPVYRTAGFGFVFPRGSPLVSDVSRAILKVTEGEQMQGIEKAWFQKQTTDCEDSSSPLSSSRLGLDSFRGLFIVVGFFSFLALIQYFIKLFKNYEKYMTKANCEARTIFQHFSSKDESSHTFRKDESMTTAAPSNNNITGMNNISQYNVIPRQSPVSGSASETALGSPSYVFGSESPTSESSTAAAGSEISHEMR